MASHPDITLFYDGLCPVCAREIAMLRRLDARHARRLGSHEARLGFVDIAAPAFDPSAHGLTMEQAIGTMHGVMADGSIVSGVEVFRRAYRAVGFGWLLAWTGWPGLRAVSNLAYRGFARIRPRLSRLRCADGRCSVGTLGA